MGSPRLPEPKSLPGPVCGGSQSSGPQGYALGSHEADYGPRRHSPRSSPTCHHPRSRHAMDPSSTSLLVAATWLEKHQALIALYGAGVATLVAVWNVYRAITNRGRLRVRVSRAVVAKGGDVEEGSCGFR